MNMFIDIEYPQIEGKPKKDHEDSFQSTKLSKSQTSEKKTSGRKQRKLKSRKYKWTFR